MIKVIGLGNEKNDLSLKAVEAIKDAEFVFLKTALTKTSTYFNENNINYVSFDSIYENAEDFSDLDSQIVDELLKYKNKKVVFCVNGSGFEDRCVELLSNKVKLSIIPAADLAASHKKPATSFIQMSAYDVISLEKFNYDTRLPLYIVDVDNKYIASEIKLVLSDILGDEEEVYFNDKKINVYDIDRQRSYSYKTTIFIDKKELKTKYRYNFIDLYIIMKVLRGENGCEWDKAQNHETIRQNLIEEAYELVDAINNEDVENMIEESGDVLLQSIFHCVIGEDLGEYSVNDAITSLCKKLIFRHPHIFGNIHASTKEEALNAWNSAKAKEKKYTSTSNKIEKISKALPALMKTKKILSILKKDGLINSDIESIQENIKLKMEQFEKTSNVEILSEIIIEIINLMHANQLDAEIEVQNKLNMLIEEKIGENS